MARLKSLPLFLLVGLLFLTQNACAVVLDWSTVTWTAGSLSNTYDVDGDGKNDISISIAGTTSAFVSGYPTATGSGLALTVDFSSPSQSITVTVNFLNNYASATGVNFSLSNLDADQLGSSSNYRYVDYVSQITASGTAGLVAPTVTGSTVTVSGSGTGQTVTGTTAGSGSATVDYGTNDISSFTYTFGDTGSIASSDPAQQTIIFGNVNFKKSIPETGSTLCALVLCGLFPTIHLLRRKMAASHSPSKAA